MDFAARTQHEQDLEAAVAAVFALFRSRLGAGGLIAVEEFRQSLTEAIQAELSAAFLAAAGQLASDRGIAFDDAASAAATWSRAQAEALASNLASSVQGEIAHGLALGESPAELAARVLSDSRAESIAITETTRAATQGMDLVAAAIAAGSIGVAAIAGTVLLTSRIWHTAKDERVCEICSPLDGRPQGEWQLDYPTGPPAHPRCRCYLTYGGLPS